MSGITTYNDIWEMLYTNGKMSIDHALSFIYSLKDINERRLTCRLVLNPNIPGQDSEDESGSSNAATLDLAVTSHVTWFGVITRTPKVVDNVIDWKDRLINISGLVIQTYGNDGSRLPGSANDNSLRTPGLLERYISHIVGETNSRIRCDFYSGAGDQADAEPALEPFDGTNGASGRRFAYARWEDSYGATSTNKNQVYFWVESITGALMIARGKTTAPDFNHDAIFLITPSPVVR